GQRLDHVVINREALSASAPQTITSFDVLQQFGAGRKGSSDHCPLWFQLGSPRSQVPSKSTSKARKPAAASESAGLHDIIAALKEVPTGFEQSTSSEDVPMTEEFAAGEADAFAAEDEEEREHHLFEDCPMPILPCSVKHGATTTPIRVLIDSGASVDLVNEK